MSDIEDRLRHAIAELRLPFVDKIGKGVSKPAYGKNGLHGARPVSSRRDEPSYQRV